MEGIFSWTQPSSLSTDKEDNIKSTKLNKFFSQLQLLFARMKFGLWMTLDTDDFLQSLSLSPNKMEDSQEFWITLSKLIQASSTSLAKLLQNIFGYTGVYQTICPICNNYSFRSEIYEELQIPVTTEEGSYHSIQDYLDRQRQSEIVGDYACDTCKTRHDVERCFLFQTLPPVLQVHLKRYEWDMNKNERIKSMDKIILSKTIDVPLYEFKNGKSDIKCTKTYNLCAVQLHEGQDAKSGHYTAEVMDWLTGTWMVFDDTEVTILQSGHNDTEGSSDAYSLFYVEKTFLVTQVNEHIQKISEGYYNKNYSCIIEKIKQEWNSIQGSKKKI